MTKVSCSKWRRRREIPTVDGDGRLGAEAYVLIEKRKAGQRLSGLQGEADRVPRCSGPEKQSGGVGPATSPSALRDEARMWFLNPAPAGPVCLPRREE
ncbi:hypothetical protein NDU88_003406 [Pleurodeles waltl]|uniref:Uncharacterized protein n=1 Tax=Pleurodeles waltl TaxID=8319 RepID=A0AAV7W5H2_PLEWA|nr:hypothetical protein NDU88_003406 [Pleurodeles waltl]